LRWNAKKLLSRRNSKSKDQLLNEKRSVNSKAMRRKT